MDTGIKRQAIRMLKYGMYAKAVELLCFKQALARFPCHTDTRTLKWTIVQ